ncbi:MAG: signal peptide peptidase SppA [Proteobacteria bacterium]|nr:signal peptide peptidase SppA [Pseudomonadota bacterium]
MPFSLISKTYQKKGFIKRHPVLIPLIAFITLSFAITVVTEEVSPILIGVVPIDGIILESEIVIKKLRILENEADVKGIVLRINSPGGAVAPSQEIYSELKRIQEKKKIFTSISSVAASGGYYIAVGSNKIYANPGSVTGSIGVILQSYNIEELMQKIGVKSQVVKSGEKKDIGSPYRTMTREEKKLLQSVIGDTHEQFIDAIANSRKLDRKRVATLADGRIFTGNQALKAELIDGLASFREVVELLKKDLGLKEKIDLFYPELPKEPLWDQLNLESLLKINKIIGYSGLFYMNEQ